MHAQFSTGSIQVQSLSQLLKQRTESAHRALESLPLSADIVSPKLTSERYNTYLLAMRAAVADLENRIFPLLDPVISDLGSRRKLHLIDSDLGSNIVETAEHLFGEVRSVAFALGILYVVEGSSLGGRYILQNVNAALPHASTSYFHGYGNSAGQKWKSFIAMIDDFAASHNCSEEIIDGANHAFTSIYNHFKMFS